MPPTSRIDRLSDYLQRQAQAAKEALRKTLYSAVISAGGLRIIDGGELRMDAEDGTQVFHIGRLNQSGTSYQGVVIRRPDGTSVFFTLPVDGNPNVVSWALRDRQETTIMGDERGGQGIMRPYIPITFQPSTWEAFGRSASNSWTTVAECRAFKQHAEVIIGLRFGAVAGTAGSWRVQSSGSTVASGTIVDGTFGQQDVRIPVAGSHLSRLALDVQVQRTSGSGEVGALVRDAIGVQSS